MVVFVNVILLVNLLRTPIGNAPFLPHEEGFSPGPPRKPRSQRVIGFLINYLFSNTIIFFISVGKNLPGSSFFSVSTYW
jgi:hypothetical protein